MIGDGVHESIRLLRVAELVKVHSGARSIVTLSIGKSRIPAVVDTRAVAGPGHSPELRKSQRVRRVSAIRYPAESPDLPIGAAIGNGVGDHVPFRARREIRERHGRIGAHRIRIEKNPAGLVQAIGYEKDALVLMAVVVQIEVTPALLHRRIEALVIPQLRQALLHPSALLNSLEARLRHFV